MPRQKEGTGSDGVGEKGERGAKRSEFLKECSFEPFVYEREDIFSVEGNTQRR